MTIQVSIMNNDSRGANAIIQANVVYTSTDNTVSVLDSRQLYGGGIWTTHISKGTDITITEIKNG